jgi:hypothetical protein
MSKKVLLSVAAVALLAMTAFAGDYKYEDWPTGTYTKTVTDTQKVKALILTIPVEIHIPYYVIIEPQDCKITLEQVGLDGDERFHFAGTALCMKDGKYKVKPVIHANFNATLSTSLNILQAGQDLDTKDSVWSHSVTPGSITATTPTELTIACSVTKVNLLAFHQCQTLHVADVLLKIIPA